MLKITLKKTAAEVANESCKQLINSYVKPLQHKSSPSTLSTSNFRQGYIPYQDEVLNEEQEIEIAIYISLQDAEIYEQKKAQYLKVMENAVNAKGSPESIIQTVHAIKECIMDEKRLINVVGPFGTTALHLAAFLNDKELAEYLLREGANPAIPDDKGFLPHEIGVKDETQAADFIGTIFKKQKWGKQQQSTMFESSPKIFSESNTWHQEDNKELQKGIKASLEQYENDAMLKSQFLVALHEATMSGKPEAFKEMASCISQDKKLLNVQGEYKQTALHVAVLYNYEEAVKFLLDMGADTTIRDQANKLPYEMNKPERSVVKFVQTMYAQQTKPITVAPVEVTEIKSIKDDLPTEFTKSKQAADSSVSKEKHQLTVFFNQVESKKLEPMPPEIADNLNTVKSLLQKYLKLAKRDEQYLIDLKRAIHTFETGEYSKNYSDPIKFLQSHQGILSIHLKEANVDQSEANRLKVKKNVN